VSGERNRRRVTTAVSIAIAGAVMLFLAFGRIGDDLVYYWSPSEIQEAGVRAVGPTIRLGGLVVPGSIERGGDGTSLTFRVSDGEETVTVFARAVPPAMFREGIGVIVEGTLREDGIFETRRLMVKHSNEYKAPDESERRSLQDLASSALPDGDDS